MPNNGIYFFYEDGEVSGHGGADDTNNNKPRIVRIGIHKDGNFKSRISEHFLLNESKMHFTSKTSASHDRSIFRKNLGRALLEGDEYLNTWKIDFTTQLPTGKIMVINAILKRKKKLKVKLRTYPGNGFHFGL